MQPAGATMKAVVLDGPGPPSALGQSLLIRGGTSSVGMATAVLARRLGMRVLSTTRQEGKAPALRAIGVDEVILDDGQVAGRVAATTTVAAARAAGRPGLPDDR